jgi:hypothetical protein
MESEDPIQQEPDGWYFWDEVWSDRYGPYPTRNKAIFEQSKYCAECLGVDCDWVFIDEEVELTEGVAS